MNRRNTIAGLPVPVGTEFPADLRARLLAPRVAGSRYIFPNLAAARRTRWALALAGREECAPDYLVERERYPFHVVEYVAAGRGEVRLGDGRARAVQAGAVFAYAPDMRCRLRADPAAPWVKFFFALVGRDVGTRLREAGLAPGTVRQFSLPTQGLALAEEILHEGERHGGRSAEICLKLIELLLLKVADSPGRAQSGATRARENFLRCRALVETQARELASLEDIARAAQLDGASVCRLFRRFEGRSPYQFLLRRKMSLAAEFLVQGGGLVKEAAAHVGFADPAHFARCFRQIHGTSPSELLAWRPRGA